MSADVKLPKAIEEIFRLYPDCDVSILRRAIAAALLRAKAQGHGHADSFCLSCLEWRAQADTLEGKHD